MKFLFLKLLIFQPLQVTECLAGHIGSALDFLELPEGTSSDFDHLTEEMKMIKEARAAGAVYVLGRSELKIDTSTSFIGGIVAGIIYPFLNSICRSDVSTMHIPPANFLEVGMYYDIID